MEDNIYIIGTTAINRPDLHNIVLPKWKKWLLGCGGKIKWFINIDILEYLKSSATLDIFLNIITGNIHFIFLAFIKVIILLI